MATGRVDTAMRTQPHGRNINGSERRVTKEKTNARSGLSRAGVGESANKSPNGENREAAALLYR